MDVKEQKLLKQDNMSIANDRISDLPETVLLSILSFLEVKNVVASSILSSKWRYLWKFVPCLDFGYPRSMKEVEEVLFSRDSLSVITKFSLNGAPRWDGSRVNAWISTVITHKVQEFILIILTTDSYILTPSLFLSKTLTRLKLVHGGTVSLQSPMSFPSLKILELVCLSFADGCVTENFSNCPILEELSIICCKWVDFTRKICISNSALKWLKIHCLECEEGNVDYLEVHAPSLVYFSLESEYLPIECSIFEMPSLVSAKVFIPEVYEYEPREVINVVAYDILGALCHVKSLMISAQILSRVRDCSGKLPEFGNLLDLDIDKGCAYVFTSSLFLIPQISPRLKTIVFEGSSSSFGNTVNDWTLDSVPGTCLLELRKVEYLGYVGLPVELALVQFLLENASVLNEIIIHVNLNFSRKPEGKQKRLMKCFMGMRKYRDIFDIRYDLTCET
ncbi:hypothetical protein ACHQM5_011366 [Ranunculus cassubicifolius]